MTDGTGTTGYDYDAYGRLSTVTDDAGAEVGYSYDTLGHIATVTYPDTHAITRQYDKAGRLQSVVDWNNQTTSFGYDGDGNLRTTTYPNGVVDTVGVDAADNATSVVVANGANTLASFGYTYTPSGLVDTTTDSIAPQTNRSYGYNMLHQLVGLDTQTAAYAYDHADNLTTLPDGSTMTYDPAGQLQALTPTSGAATGYGFDGVGNRTTSTGATSTTYSYNQADQLTTSTTAAGIASYDYNGDGLRSASTNSGGRQAFAWDLLTASLPLLLTDGTNDFVYGPNDKVVEQVDQSSGTARFLHQDRAGSTRLITDGGGAVVATSSYDPYGTLAGRTGTATSPFGYDGEYTDPSGLIYLRARYYDPATGQFLTPDPLVDLTRTPYAYAGDDPINNADPRGLDGFENPGGIPELSSGEDMTDYPGGYVPMEVVQAEINSPYALNPWHGDGLLENEQAEGSDARELGPSDVMLGDRDLVLEKKAATERQSIGRESKPDSNLLSPGPNAKGSVPARGPLQTFLQAERKLINQLGEKFGCHSCGADSPGTKSGNWVPDHQPVSAISKPGTSQKLYPQCLACSRAQGLEVANLVRGGYKFE